jgi:hypothetical protein
MKEVQMELGRYIGRELSGLKIEMERIIDDLSQQEVMWRPASGCNSIGLILFHVARSEDSMIHGILKGTPEIWMSEKWYEKLALPAGLFRCRASSNKRIPERHGARGI